MRRSTLLLSAFGVTLLACATVASEERGRRLAEQSSLDIPGAVADVDGAASPMTLTASDGTGLKLVSLTASAVVEDPLAFTELTLVFENPLDRQLEGQFRITLPQDASLSRFAMKIDDRWQEGEVVEKQAARRAYEDFLHRKQDPALLEQGGGNEFAARVFPIPARGRKEIVLSYSETLRGDVGYTLPLRGLPKLEQLDIDVRGGDGTGGPKTLHRSNFAPARDFVLEGRNLARNAAITSEGLAVARVVPFVESRPEPVGRALVLVDTSASRALDLVQVAQLLASLIAKLPPETPLAVHTFDEEVAPLYTGAARGFGQAQTDALVARRALGASNLELALKHAKVAAEQAAGTRRVILVTDGVATAGETDATKLAAVAASLARAGVERLDAIAVGSVRDDALLRRVTGRNLARSGVVLAAERGAEVIARRLGEAASRDVPVTIDGARWSYPKVLDGVQSGDEVLVFAELSEPRPVVIGAGGHTFRPAARKVERPLLERAWAKAKIESLVARPLTEGEAATKAAIVALSTRHRVVSPHTAFLVLETEQDYRRFHIDRRAKLDILTIAEGQVRVVHRARGEDDDDDGPRREKSARATGEERSRDPNLARQGAHRADGEHDPLSARGNMWGDAIGDSFGAGGLGLSGIGEGGGGRADGVAGGLAGGVAGGGLGTLGTLGHGSGAGGAPQGFGAASSSGAGPGRLSGSHHTADRVVVRAGPVEVGGRLAPEVITRIMRQNLGRFRQCYTQGLQGDPGLGGVAEVRFVIDRSGALAGSEVRFRNAEVRACLQRAMQHVSFPAPDGGLVTVVYKISLGNEDGSPAPTIPPVRWSQTPGGTGNLATVAPRPGASDAMAQRLADGEIAGQQGVRGAPPYEGKFKDILGALSEGKLQDARDRATLWQRDSPSDVLALVALGETAEKAGDRSLAARSYGSIIDLFGFRADSRRFAGARLERLGDAASLELAVDTYTKAVEQRPDHPAGHRLLAFALLKQKHHERAFEACAKGLARDYPPGRFAGAKQILAEDLGLIAAAWQKAAPHRRAEIQLRLAEAHGTVESGPSLRFVLNWETDANDVDFHVRDARGGHAFYGNRTLASGGSLYADVTTGYGPECFTIRATREARAYPYRLEAHYFARGPMGYGMGKLQIIDHDGDGGLTFEERPYVVMVDHAYVDLGQVTLPK